MSELALIKAEDVGQTLGSDALSSSRLYHES